MLPAFTDPHMHQISPRASPKFTIATSVFIFCCLLSTVRVLRDAPSPGRRQTNDLANGSDQRFAALKAALPPQGIVGYIGEPGDPADYYLAQYALAPLIVDHSPNHPLVVGNFPLSRPANLSDHLHMVKDFGNGVLLFANKDTQ
jgi:hypothetical protein